MTGKIILVTGGARSGKSAFAEKLAAKGKKVAYIATAQIFDNEMAFRVKLHKKRRPVNWQTFEAPFNAEDAIMQAAADNDVILFDCITLYISNILCQLAEKELAIQADVYKFVQAQIKKLLQAALTAAQAGVTVIFVTNEVGAGIVPENKLARLYRDVSGLANQQLAEKADSVFAVIAGLPVDIKKLAGRDDTEES